VKITVFERGVACLVAHEVDHLHGTLYVDRMQLGVKPIPSSSTAVLAQAGGTDGLLEWPTATRSIRPSPSAPG